MSLALISMFKVCGNCKYDSQPDPGYLFQANMLEGGGKTPILSPMELEEIGFKIVAYPLSLVGVSIRAMQVKILK